MQPHPSLRRSAGLAWARYWLVLLACGWLAARAADAEQAEYQIKAAFLCKFGNYIEWPAEAGAAPDFVIAVMASPAIGDELVLAARGQTVHGRPILVRRTERVAELIEGAAIVYIARSHAARVGEALAVLKDRPVLTVTELAQEQATQGIVNFVVVDDKVKFDISLAAAARSSLRISARLLHVARHVTGRAAP